MLVITPKKGRKADSEGKLPIVIVCCTDYYNALLVAVTEIADPIHFHVNSDNILEDANCVQLSWTHKKAMPQLRHVVLP